MSIDLFSYLYFNDILHLYNGQMIGGPSKNVCKQSLWWPSYEQLMNEVFSITLCMRYEEMESNDTF